MSQRLTPKQEQFAALYLELGNAAEAYRRVYGSRSKPGTSYSEASRLLSNPKITARVNELTSTAAARAGITKERWFRELANIAHSDLGAIARWSDAGVSFIPSDQLAPEVRRTVAGFTVKRRRIVTGGEDGPQEWELEEIAIKLWEKVRALGTIGKAMGWSVERVEHSGEIGIREYVGVDLEQV